MNTRSEDKSGLFHLKNTNYNPNLFMLFSFISFVFLVAIIGVIYISLNTLSYIALVPIFLFLMIYFVGISYSEYNARYDFIKTTTSGVEYCHSPKFLHIGWLPKKGVLKYTDIQSINLIQIQSGLDLLEQRMKQTQLQPESFLNKQLLLDIHTKDGKSIKIGERLSSAGLVQLAVFIESGAKLGDLFANFAEKFPNAANVAKNLYSKFFKK